MLNSDLGPISTALEAELRQRVQQNGIVIWLDRDSLYTQLVDQLQAQRADGQLPYAVHGFRGSHLDLMLELKAQGVTQIIISHKLNEIGRVTMRVTQPLFIDEYRRNRVTGSFILMDEATDTTVGAGMLLAGS